MSNCWRVNADCFVVDQANMIWYWTGPQDSKNSTRQQKIIINNNKEEDDIERALILRSYPSPPSHYFWTNSQLLVILADACWGIQAALSNHLRQIPAWTLFPEAIVSYGTPTWARFSLNSLSSDFPGRATGQKHINWASDPERLYRRLLERCSLERRGFVSYPADGRLLQVFQQTYESRHLKINANNNSATWNRRAVDSDLCHWWMKCVETCFQFAGVPCATNAVLYPSKWNVN